MDISIDTQRNCTNVTFVGAQKGAIEDLFGNWSLLRVFEKQKVHKQGRKEPRNNVWGVTQFAESKVELVMYISGNWCILNLELHYSNSSIFLRLETGITWKSGLITNKGTMEQKYVIAGKCMAQKILNFVPKLNESYSPSRTSH